MPKHDYHWTFGDRCHISFPNGGAPVLDIDQGFLSYEGCAAVSDSSGNLVFYTDGQKLYNASHLPIPSLPLGGSNSSCHSAIIVPPAGGGSLYHIVTMRDWDGIGQPNVGPLTHTAVSVSGGVSISSGPTALTAFGAQESSERLAAIPHTDCNKYWVVSLNVTDATPHTEGPATFYAMLIDSDLGPTAPNTVSQPYPYKAAPGYCIKFSPDGRLVAIASYKTIDILNFDRATGAISPHSRITNFEPNKGRAYGVEFSPNGKYLYFSHMWTGSIKRHTIANGTTPMGATDLIGTSTETSSRPYVVGALQLAPNGKIYGAKVGITTLLEIGDPNNSVAALVQFNLVATDLNGGQLTLNNAADLGLPTFTRIADDCIDECKTLAAEVDAQLAAQLAELENSMLTCAGDAVKEPGCAPLEIPEIGPVTSISWGSSPCDCIEGDDTEIMHLTVCNPYSNLTLSNLIVHQLVVVDASGQPVPDLPDGTPSIQLVPIGPYCFDDIAPCTCVTREFVLRLRGTPGGIYNILVRGICFDACLHGDTEACFAFEVCKD